MPPKSSAHKSYQNIINNIKLVLLFIIFTIFIKKEANFILLLIKMLILINKKQENEALIVKLWHLKKGSFMKYRDLATLYHMDSSSSRESTHKKEYNRRFNMESTFRLGISTDKGELFIAVPREMTVLMERVMQTEQKLSRLVDSLPPLANFALIRGLVLDEVVSTNAIENIHSTRAQVKEALEAGLGQRSGNSQYRRFKELALLYFDIADNSRNVIPKTLEDLRRIYDKVIDGELNESQNPDGKLFRAGGVQITAGGVKVVHNGVEPEKRINEYLKKMIDLTSRTDIPELLRTIASHYVFEYVHPFYDGNGRTGRYLLSLYLCEALSTPTVLSLSRVISENKNTYYAAFSSAEKVLNCAELTFFVYSILELIRIAQSETLDRIQMSQSQLTKYNSNCKHFLEKHALTSKELKIVHVFAHFSLFGVTKNVSLNELSEATSAGKQTVRKYTALLEEKGLIEKISQHPLSFALSPIAERELGIVDV